MLGIHLGQYRITGTLGRGGMGAVYTAEHTLIGRPAAVKVLLPELSRHADIVSRFFNEARAATSIRHPGIVEIYDFGFHTDGAAYIVMELLQGESLATRLARGRMPIGAALAIIRQMAGALGAAHAKDIVHRDLKPDNVFLVPDPEVPGGERIKLLDFGIAKLAGENTLISPRTRDGTVMGTPTYMAPEQCRGVNVDHRADLYALGCILFELCTGRPPFVGEGQGDVLAAHIHVPAPSLTSVVPEIPAEVDALARRLLTKDPAQRLGTCEELIRAIDRLGSVVALGVVALGPVPILHPASRPTRPVVTPPSTLSGSAWSVLPPTPPAPRSKMALLILIVLMLVGGLLLVISSASTRPHLAAAAPPSPPRPLDPLPPDAAPSDAPAALPTDAAPPADAGPRADAAPSDARLADAAPADARPTDARPADAAVPVDAGRPIDAARPDAGLPVDAGPSPAKTRRRRAPAPAPDPAASDTDPEPDSTSDAPAAPAAPDPAAPAPPSAGLADPFESPSIPLREDTTNDTVAPF